MKKFVLVYYGQPEFKTAEEAKVHQAAWMEWAGALGDKMVEMGNPAKPGKNISKAGVVDADGDDRFMGYTIIRAKDLDEAIEMTKRCPYVADGGTMGVHELQGMGA
jgi:hypothetical protein